MHSGSQLGLVERDLGAALEGLRVDLAFRETGPRGWVAVSVSGEDQNAAMRYLEETVGFCPLSAEDVRRFSVFRGYVVDPAERKDELRVDVGLFSPRVVDAVVSLRSLQAQLADGRKVALAKLVELFGLCENLPLEVRVLGVDLSSGRAIAELAEGQRELFGGWAGSFLDRLLVVGASRAEVDAAVSAGGVFRDVVGVDSLGFFEHALVCKLGTDAAGLIPRVGRVLRKAGLGVFSGRRVVEFLGEGWVSSISS